VGGKREREKQMQVTDKLHARRKPEKIQPLSIDDCRIQRVANSKPKER